MKKTLLGTLMAAATVLALTGCNTTTAGDPDPIETPSTAPSSAPVPTATATPDAPEPSFPVATPTSTPSTTASKGSAAAKALAQLDSLTVAEADYGVDYNRTRDFGAAWLDVDNNGCDTRNDILKRDLTDIVYREDDPTCTIASGTLADPYTGNTIAFTRGQSTSMAVQIDHVWPLLLSDQHGAANWTQEKREQFANDPFNLLAVDGPSNSSKGAKGPADWLPPDAFYTCDYVEHFVAVGSKYDLTISRRDAAESHKVLNACK